MTCRHCHCARCRHPASRTLRLLQRKGERVGTSLQPRLYPKAARNLGKVAGFSTKPIPLATALPMAARPPASSGHSTATDLGSTRGTRPQAGC